MKRKVTASRRELFGYAALVWIAGLTAGYPSEAAPVTGWSVQLDPMFMAVFGNDIGVAAVTRISPTQTSTEGVDMEMDPDFAIRGEVQYMAHRWGFGASGFWFNPNGEVENTQDLGGSNVLSIASSNLVLNAAPGGPNRLRYSANSELNVWSADFYGIRTLAETEESHVQMLFGVKIGDLSGEFSERGEQGTFAGGVFTPTAIHTNRANSNWDILVGPLVGVSGDARYDKHRLKGFLQQSLLLGEAAVSRREANDTNADGVVDTTDTFDSTNNCGVPVTEFGFKYLYDVTENVALGLGGYASVWWDAPTAPGADFSASGFAGNSLNEQTLVFIGGSASVDVKF